MVQIVGKYEYTTAENFEEYMKSLGKPELVDMFMQSTPVVEVQQNGDQWTITVTSKGKSVTSTFKLGEVYEEQMPSQQNIVFKVDDRSDRRPSFKRRRARKIGPIRDWVLLAKFVRRG